jgi:hypothetical protein
MRKLKALFILMILSSTLPAFGLTLVYIEESRMGRVEHTVTIEPTAGGYSIVVTSVAGEAAAITQELETDRGYSVLSWRYRDRESGTDITGIRRKSSISLSGRYRGRTVERRYKIDSKPWYQLFPHGLERLAVSGEQEPLLFYAVGIEGIGATRIGTFRAKPGEIEEIDWNGRRHAAVHVHISLTGFASILWSGDYWYRPSDGRNLVSKSDRGPGTQPIIFQLISER